MRKTRLLHAPLHFAYRAARGAGGERRIGLQRGRDVALAVLRLPGGIALGLFRRAAAGELLVGDFKADAAVRNVDRDAVAGAHQADIAAFGSLRRQMANRQAGRAARETTISDERAGFAE